MSAPKRRRSNSSTAQYIERAAELAKVYLSAKEEERSIAAKKETAKFGIKDILHAHGDDEETGWKHPSKSLVAKHGTSTFVLKDVYKSSYSLKPRALKVLTDKLTRAQLNEVAPLQRVINEDVLAHYIETDAIDEATAARLYKEADGHYAISVTVAPKESK